MKINSTYLHFLSCVPYFQLDPFSIGLEKLVIQSRFEYSLVCRFYLYVSPSALYVDPFSTSLAVFKSNTTPFSYCCIFVVVYIIYMLC